MILVVVRPPTATLLLPLPHTKASNRGPFFAGREGHNTTDRAVSGQCTSLAFERCCKLSERSSCAALTTDLSGGGRGRLGRAVHVQAIAATDATAAPATKTEGGDKPKPKSSRGRNNSRGPNRNRWSKVRRHRLDSFLQASEVGAV